MALQPVVKHFQVRDLTTANGGWCWRGVFCTAWAVRMDQSIESTMYARGNCLLEVEILGDSSSMSPSGQECSLILSISTYPQKKVPCERNAAMCRYASSYILHLCSKLMVETQNKET